MFCYGIITILKHSPEQLKHCHELFIIAKYWNAVECKTMLFQHRTKFITFLRIALFHENFLVQKLRQRLLYISVTRTKPRFNVTDSTSKNKLTEAFQNQKLDFLRH